MKKLFVASLFCSCCFAIGVFASPAEDKVLFDAAIRHVDMGGEMLYFQNTAGIQKLFNDTVPALLDIALKDNPSYGMVKNGYNSLRRIININAFKAYAMSSKQSSGNIYLFKTFTLFDKKQTSILVNPAAKNVPLDWQQLPGNTIIAIKGQINMAHAWNLIRNEIINNPDPAIKALEAQLNVLKQVGTDIDVLLSGINGTFEFIVAGVSPETLAVKLVIPDERGAVSAKMKQLIPQQQNSSAMIPTPHGSIHINYGKNSITAAFQPDLLKNKNVPVLGIQPQFQQYAKILPANGSGYVVVNISADLLNTIKQIVESNPNFGNFAAMLKTVSMAVVTSEAENGTMMTTASNFSIPQIYQAASMLIPYMSMMLPALNSARDRSSQVSCTNNMKQFGLACHIYANANRDTLPPSAEIAAEKSNLKDEIIEDIIYLGRDKKLSQIKNPSQFPIAICDRTSHNEDKVCVLFADGHVESIAVPKDINERGIIGELNKLYKYSPDDLDFLLKQAAEF